MKNIVHFMFAIMLIGVLAACGGDATDNNDVDQDDTTETPETDDTTINEDDDDQATEEKPDQNDDGIGNDEATNGDVAQDDDQATIKETMEELGLAEIEIKVEYPNDNEYELEIDKSSQGNYEVELDDEINNIKLKGMDAFDTILPNLEKLDITKESSKEDVIAQVIEAFELNDDYEEYDIEVIFSDGTKMEFESDN